LSFKHIQFLSPDPDEDSESGFWIQTRFTLEEVCALWWSCFYQSPNIHFDIYHKTVWQNSACKWTQLDSLD